MRLAGFDTGEDAQVREHAPASFDTGQVSLDVDRVHPFTLGDLRRDIRGLRDIARGGRVVVVAPLGEIDMLGERDRRQADLDRAAAGLFHRRVDAGVPGEFGVHVIIGGKHRDNRRTADAAPVGAGAI
jgi:hypothetical protein